ncbi:MAG: alpha/beta fold hydrolase [Bacteroidetes bacterium]|nr:alpha/beta fold hydrolase [Bacteroidota bacterium]
MRKIDIMILASIGLLIVLTFLFSYFLSYVALKPKRRPKKKTPADLGLDFEEIEFLSAGTRLSGWFVASDNPSRSPTLVFVHGWESSSQGMLPHLEYLKDLKLNFLLYDARGHGDSGPIDYMSLVRMSEDLENALKYALSRRDLNPNQILLFGHSMGAAAAVTVAARRHDIQGLVASSGFANFRLLTEDMLRPMKIPYWPVGSLMMLFWRLKIQIKIDDWNPTTSIRKIRAPLLLAHGGNDEVVSSTHFQRLCDSLPKGDHLLITAGRHRNLHEFEEYRLKVIEFFKNLAQKTSPKIPE